MKSTTITSETISAGAVTWRMIAEGDPLSVRTAPPFGRKRVAWEAKRLRHRVALKIAPWLRTW